MNESKITITETKHIQSKEIGFVWVLSVNGQNFTGVAKTYAEAKLEALTEFANQLGVDLK